MNAWTADELRSRYLEFFSRKGHAVIPSASLIPENDATVLFTTAGMHPLVPYLLGEKHPAGARLTGVQKCVRTGDIEEVGDRSHLTFFEMLGNWSLGDYFKAEAIAWSWEFLTSPDWLGIDPDRLAVSVFAGDEDAPRDEESAALWRECGMPAERIFYLPKKNNWWGPAGQTGPCGPDTEMFIIGEQPPCGPGCGPDCGCGRYLEIWNDVFMQYNKRPDGSYEPLRQRNVDTGMGLERTVTALQGKDSVYETDVFAPILQAVSALSGKTYGEDAEITRAMRIVSDHLRTATFILGDEKGVTPSNVDQGYVLRRVIRRAVRFGRRLEMPEGFTARLAEAVVAHGGGAYPELAVHAGRIADELRKEEERFAQTLDKGEREFEKVVRFMGDSTALNGKTAFRLYDTYGFPIELTCEMAAERGLTVDMAGYEEAFRRHQEVSAAGVEGRFKGGLADNTEATARLHTATHLLNAALRALLSADIAQRGSNITPERLRFDFNFPRRVEPEELARVEAWVNAAIAADVPVTCRETSVEAARAGGAEGVFASKYGDVVKVYTIGAYSREICGGPHAARTGELGVFRIQKEQASSAGVRRIRAVLEPLRE